MRKKIILLAIAIIALSVPSIGARFGVDMVLNPNITIQNLTVVNGTNLNDSDYVLVNGTRELTGDWEIGGYNISSNSSAGRTVQIGTSDSIPYASVGTTSNHNFGIITNNVRTWVFDKGGDFYPTSDFAYGIGSLTARVSNIDAVSVDSVNFNVTGGVIELYEAGNFKERARIFRDSQILYIDNWQDGDGLTATQYIVLRPRSSFVGMVLESNDKLTGAYFTTTNDADDDLHIGVSSTLPNPSFTFTKSKKFGIGTRTPSNEIQAVHSGSDYIRSETNTNNQAGFISSDGVTSFTNALVGALNYYSIQHGTAIVGSPGLSISTGNAVYIGLFSGSARLNINGINDIVQQNIRGHSVQSNPLMTFTQFAGTKVIDIENDGSIEILADNAGLKVGGASDASFYYDGTDAIINPKVVGTGDLNVLGNFNATDNISGNDYYAEMHFHNDTTGIRQTIVTQNVWVNITGFNGTGGTGDISEVSNFTNGFFLNDAENALEVIIPGRYLSAWYMSFGNDGNNQEYQIRVSVNGDNEEYSITEAHRKIGAAGDVGSSSGGGSIILEAGDLVKLIARNNDGTGDLLVHSATLTLQRIGDA